MPPVRYWPGFRVLRRRPLALLAGCLLLLTHSTGCDSEPPGFQVHLPGVRQPRVYHASEVRLPDAESVIGIVARGRARAYLVRALGIPSHQDFRVAVMNGDMRLLADHVVNDLIQDVPISVTYCDSTECKRVFTAESPQPLELLVGGTDGERMTLEFQGQPFAQDSVAAPLAQYPFETMAWGEWKRQFPETSVYLGRYAPEYVIDYIDPAAMGPLAR